MCRTLCGAADSCHSIVSSGFQETAGNVLEAMTAIVPMIAEGSSSADTLDSESNQQTSKDLATRLQYLELWRELGIRPDANACFPEDLEILRWAEWEDDCVELGRRSLHCRESMNAVLPASEVLLDDLMVPKLSTIPGAGMGLFFGLGKSPISPGTKLCYYAGHIHNYHSAKHLSNIDYLMMLSSDVLVDAAPLVHVKARYINDPLRDDAVNCVFVPEGTRAAVVSTRIIHPGDELFASYGDAYWAQREVHGTVLKF